MIYLDYQATTPLAPEVLAAMGPWLDAEWANPHAAHGAGRRAMAAIEHARGQILALLPPGGRLFFTGSATEAANWALRCTRGVNRIVYGATEHPCVRDTAEVLATHGRSSHIWPVDHAGILNRAPPLCGAGAETLAALMLVNNEIGVISAVEPAWRALGHPIRFCDAVQGFGRVPVPQDCDLVAIAAHKIHGPKGIGALWVRDGVAIDPLLTGGGQEGGLRSGTLSPALCVGFGRAAELAGERMEQDRVHVDRLWALALDRLGSGWILNGAVAPRWPGNLSIRRDGLDAGALISALRGVALSSGSACASGSGRPSAVLQAIGLNRAQAQSTLRLGFGRYTREAELAQGIAMLRAASADQARSRGGD